MMHGDARKGDAAMNIIAYIHNDFQEKFGIPRQSGVVGTALSEIVFEPTTGVRRHYAGWKVFPISG